jgi:23S rRNA pseudouridine955/2504/2580 synthase
MTLTAGADDAGRRLDRILRRALPDLPLSGIHRMLRKGRVLVDGKPAAAEDRIAAGALITIPAGGVAEDLPGAGGPPRGSPRGLPAGARLERRGGQSKGKGPEKRPGKGPPLPDFFSLDILAEDGNLLVVNKPAGLAVHGAGSLDEAVRAYLAGKAAPSLSFRPGPLHRLDKPTSGLIVFSKTLAGARRFSALLREGRIIKRYLAVLEGRLTEPALWEDFLIRDRVKRKSFRGGEAGGEGAAGAKKARTRVRPLSLSAGPAGAAGKAGGFSLILAELETGRTHQIRAQAAARGFPLAGDKKYGGAFQPGGFLLHAWTLELPAEGAEKPRRISAPPPERFRRRLRELFGEDAERLLEAERSGGRGPEAGLPLVLIPESPL